jgi:hypothetical protein
MGTRDDLLIQAARIICTTDIPCRKHLEQAQRVLDLAGAYANAGKQSDPLWTLAEGEVTG